MTSPSLRKVCGGRVGGMLTNFSDQPRSLVLVQADQHLQRRKIWCGGQGEKFAKICQGQNMRNYYIDCSIVSIVSNVYIGAIS